MSDAARDRAAHVRFMQRALELAARGLGDTNPNPVVGCVVVRSGRVVGEAFHQRAGEAHAEVLALRQAGAAAGGATLYVTLEPCAHHGRTPPCAPRVAASGVRRVVIAQADPNPAVDGRGVRLLRAAGVEVVRGVMAGEAALLNRRFNAAIASGRPFVTLKAATTLDGRIATAAGDSKWITSPAQRRAARALRRLHDAVAVGISTVLADDPRLLPQPAAGRPFTRVVFDSHLRLPPGSRLARGARRSPVLAVYTQAPPRRRRALEALGVRLVPVPAVDDGRVALGPALAALRGQGLLSLMVEGGGELLGGFLAARLLDEVVLFRAPLLLGGASSRPAFGGPDPRVVADALRMRPASPSDGERALLGDPAGWEWWRV